MPKYYYILRIIIIYTLSPGRWGEARTWQFGELEEPEEERA
jgi:hypothetical protein